MTLRGRKICLVLCVAAIALNTACGGGGSGSPAPVQHLAPFVPALVITTNPTLPGAVNGLAYSTTLTAANGQGALHWSITPSSPGSQFVDGLSVDPATGVLSGTANFLGFRVFVASVTDSSATPRSTTQTFTLVASPPLSAVPDRNITMAAFQANFGNLALVEGGVPPLRFSITSGSLPPGLRMASSDGNISGAAYRTGTSQFTITVTDSFSPPEVVTQRITLKIIPPTLSVAVFIPPILPLNRPFGSRVVANGGVPPYSFALASGGLPTGMGPINAQSGNLGGTPTAPGQFVFTVRATDSDSPRSTATATFFVTVAAAKGRNDTPATATRVSNGITSASISPYIDPPNGVPSAADQDYYKIVSLGESTVHIATQSFFFSGITLDPVLEIVDANGFRLSTCRLPGDTTTTFGSPCLNDDMSDDSLDSALDFQVPGSRTEATTFFAHVLDWRGNARPDMRYTLSVSGAVEPLEISSSNLIPGARGRAYNQQVLPLNGVPPFSWSLASGALPAGLNLSSSGVISGTPTAVGDNIFTVRVTDSSSPPQTATAQKSIRIVEPLKITSSPTFPDACVNRPYTFTPQSSGGAPPLFWTFNAPLWVAGINLNPATGVFSGSPQSTATLTGRLSVSDATQVFVFQDFTFTIKQCP